MADEAPLPPLPPRARDAHKASVGRVLVVGGSLGMAGAPALAARGALRAGAGLVTVAVPRAVQPVVAGFLAEAMTAPLPCDDSGVLGPDALGALAPLLPRADAVVLGPGLARAEATAAFVREVVTTVRAPLVVDADALHALRGRLDLLGRRPGATVVTPHEGEAAGLLGDAGGLTPASRAERAARIATAGRCVCVLKGPGTVVTDGTRTRVNGTGNAVLATGGTGDVLAGVVAAFLAGLPDTGGDAFGAAALAVHVHGRAGDLLAARRGDRGALASEVADALPEAVRERVEAARP